MSTPDQLRQTARSNVGAERVKVSKWHCGALKTDKWLWLLFSAPHTVVRYLRKFKDFFPRTIISRACYNITHGLNIIIPPFNFLPSYIGLAIVSVSSTDPKHKHLCLNLFSNLMLFLCFREYDYIRTFSFILDVFCA